MSSELTGPSPGDDGAPPPRPPRRLRGHVRTLRPVLRTSALLLAGAGLVLGAGAVADPVGLPGGTASGGEERAAGEALLSTRALACPGPEQRGVTDGSVQEVAQQVTAQGVTPPAAALPEGLRTDGAGTAGVGGLPPGGPEAETTARAEPVQVALEGARGALVRVEGALAPGAAGAQLSLSQDVERRGLLATPCTEPVTEAFLVAGGGQAGRTERLVLTNPGGDAVTVDVAVLGQEGPRGAPGGRGIVVAPGQRHVLLVDALAPGEPSPVLHVTTDGGPVAAALGDRWLEGTRDLGMTLTPPTTAPGTDLVVPGLRVPDDARVRTGAQLRVAVPGETEAVVQVRVLTPEGPVRIDQDVSNVPAGHVVDIPLGALPPGNHAVQVRSDEPVVAGALLRHRASAEVEQVHREGPLGDIAWLPATPAVGQLAGGPVPAAEEVAAGTALVLASREEQQATVVTVDGDGSVDSREVAVPAAGTVAVGVPAGGSAWVAGGGDGVHAALVTLGRDDAGPYVAAAPLPPAPLTRDISSLLPWLP